MTQTPSPDIQQRETIARIIDPDAWGEWSGAPGYESAAVKSQKRRQEAALAKADAAILALRSNPQPGSEGEPVAWTLVECRGDKLVRAYLPCINGLSAWFSIATIYRPDEGANGYSEGATQALFDRAVALFAASPTPPTAQPGEVERLREADDPAFVAALAREIHRDANGPSVWGSLTDLGREYYAKRTAQAIDRARAALTPKGGEEGNV